MGCNISRLDANGANLPARLRPLLLQRFDEIKARRHGGRGPLKDPTPSKKELLFHDDINNIDQEESNASDHHHLISHVHSSKNTTNSLEERVEKPEQQTKGKEVEKIKEEAPDDKDNKAMIAAVKTNGNNDDNHDGIKKNDQTKESPMGGLKDKIEDYFTDADEGLEDDDDDDDDDDDERMIGYEDDEAFPGSPSFRVYFKDNEVDLHKDNDGKNDDALKETAVSSDDGAPSNSKESISVIDDQKKVKRAKKRRSFRRVLPKGGQAAMKNLLSMKSCYTSSSHSSHDHARLLTAKTNT